MPELMYGRTTTQVAVAQGGAGTLDIVTAPGAGLKIYVVLIVLSIGAAGTVKFQSGTGPTDLTGAFAVANGTPLQLGNGMTVILETALVNQKFSVVSTGGGANGFIRYYVAP